MSILFSPRRTLAAKWFSPAAFALLAALVSSGCNKPGQQGAQPPPPSVTVQKVASEPLVEWHELTGRLAPVEFVEVRPRVSGHVRKVMFESGQMVEKGAVLFEIDPRWHEAELARRNADLEQAKARLATAEREASRTTQLLDTKAISVEDAEARQSRLLEARAAVLGAEAAVATAKLDLEYTQIRSPIRGQASRALVTEGNYVSGTGAMGAVLTTVVSTDPVHVYADLDENALLRFNRLQAEGKLTVNADGKIPVGLGLGDEEGYPHAGYLESFDNRVDPAQGSIVLRAIFNNPSGRMVPGLYARLRIPGSAEYPAVLVDERAIGTDLAQKYVLTLTSSNTVAYRTVTLGPSIGGRRVIRSGLEAGEEIVVEGLQKARPGMPVTPERAPASVARR